MAVALNEKPIRSRIFVKDQGRMDDSELIRAVQRRMPFALEVLVSRYEDTVLHLALQLTGSEREARRIYQAAFQEIHRNPRLLAGGVSPANCLNRLVARLSLEFLRKNRRNAYTASSGAKRIKAAVGVFVERPAPSSARRCLDSLSPRERVAFVLKHYHRMSLETISEVLETQQEAMRKVLLRAIDKMRAFALENTLEFLLQ
jgi:RNA polymerase sigma-70 factor, ECF subfamily